MKLEVWVDELITSAKKMQNLKCVDAPATPVVLTPLNIGIVLMYVDSMHINNVHTIKSGNVVLTKKSQ